MPELVKELFATHGQELERLKVELREIEAKLKAWHRQNEMSPRLAEVNAIGPIGACLLAIKAPDPQAFRCGRDFAAWMGLTPKDHSTAGKMRLGVITRAGDEALRCTLVVGATSVIKQVSKLCLALAAGSGGAQTAEARGRGACQQGCTHRLETDAQRRTL